MSSLHAASTVHENKDACTLQSSWVVSQNTGALPLPKLWNSIAYQDLGDDPGLWPAAFQETLGFPRHGLQGFCKCRF